MEEKNRAEDAAATPDERPDAAVETVLAELRALIAEAQRAKDAERERRASEPKEKKTVAGGDGLSEFER